MTFVYSFWSKPFRQTDTLKNFGEFNNAHDFNISWSLSVKTVKRFYPKIILVTDTWSWDNIFKDLDLPFTEVRFDLDGIDHNYKNWSISKAYAVLSMNEPFIHIDSDAYLWKSLPKDFLYSSVCTQSEEGKWDPTQWELYDKISKEYRKYLLGTSKYLDLFSTKDRDLLALNTALLGGYNLDFLHQWANEMIKVGNAYDKLDLDYNSRATVWFEQSLLLMMAEYHHVPITTLLGKNIYLNQSFYTHLCSGKKDIDLINGVHRIYNESFT